MLGPLFVHVRILQVRSQLIFRSQLVSESLVSESLYVFRLSPIPTLLGARARVAVSGAGMDLIIVSVVLHWLRISELWLRTRLLLLTSSQDI